MLNGRPVPAVCLVVALPAEGRPLRRHFGLERDPGLDRKPVYRRGRLALTLSGPGREAARETVAWCLERGLGGPDDLWVNIGIAGHATAPLGRVLLADPVEEPATGRRWACGGPLPPGWRASRLLTLDAPGTGYRDDALLDMEAAGFLEGLEAFGACGRGLCVKVVSDNAATGIGGLNGRRVSQLVEGAVPAIEGLLRDRGWRP